MLFTEIKFLFLFLPIVLSLYFVSPRALRNAVLLAASLVFYAAGERWYMLVMVGSIVFNYVAGLVIGSVHPIRPRRLLLAAACTVNLGALASYKYADFIVGNLNGLLRALNIAPMALPRQHLPLGISFFTFHALSYVTDVYRREVKPMRSLTSFSLYITLFPQLIAGPIIRYKTIQDQFGHRRETWAGFEEGIRRFIIGLGKKMLIANTVAVAADKVFSAGTETLIPAAAWLGVVCYALQIYYDFSGYSDMAIGLGKMFGFTFPENFNYPYIANSITDFWRRWHISLSSWFRDYLYIPLGGNRVAAWRTYLNLAIVFFLCGLWHGASWTFVFWGLFHGAFLIVERVLGVSPKLGAARSTGLPALVLRHVYVIVAVLVGWVFFRSDTIAQAFTFLKVMAFMGHAKNHLTMDSILNPMLNTAIVAGIVGATPIVSFVLDAQARLGRAMSQRLSPRAGRVMLELWCATTSVVAFFFGGAVFLLSASLSAAGTYNPFIYFRF